MDESKKMLEGRMGRAASLPVYLLQGILVCKAAGPGSLSLLELNSVSKARGRKRGKKSEIREGHSREAAAAKSHTPILRGAQAGGRHPASG